MLQFSRFKTLAILASVLAALIFALPNVFDKQTVEQWPSFLPRKQVSLGLDLRGGAHLLLAMDTAELRKDMIDNLREDVRRTLRDARIGAVGVAATSSGVQVRLAKPEEAEKALTELRRLAQPLTGSLLSANQTSTLTVTGGEGGLISLALTDGGIQQRTTDAIGAAIETVRRRVDAVGTTEPNIVRQGRDRILVQVPGLQDTAELKALLGRTAKLSFHDVHPQVYDQGGRAPAGYRSYKSAEGTQNYLLRETAIVRGDELVDANPGFDQRTNEAIITFRFDNSGARKFARFTETNVGRPFAIVLDDEVLSAPVIRERIPGGSGQISGSFTAETANQLAIQLRSGALPAKLTIVEERTVGPSLGADSIKAGTTAFIIGAVATVIVTIIAYGTFGIFAVAGLLVNGLLLLAIMTAAGSTLTLPGIAGLVLTIGMAVDANVLIYERIREELANGRSPINAIEAGFSRAMVTILDSQLTTLAAAIIMFWLGSGPIRGFAVTLSIGIFTTILSAVTIVRLIISWWIRSARTRSRTIEVPI